jgi:hypothetical protein
MVTMTICADDTASHSDAVCEICSRKRRVGDAERSFRPPQPESRRRCGRGEPSPGADVGGVSALLALMWAG